MSPAPGERLLRFVGDRVRFSLRLPAGFPRGARALLRTNLGKAERTRQEIIDSRAGKNPMSAAFWRDVPLLPVSETEWSIEIPLTDVGFYRAKPYFVDASGRQVWPEGADAGISVHPDAYRCGNTIYCAFPRMFGPNKTERQTEGSPGPAEIQRLDKLGYVVIPPSGKLRDLRAEIPHIIDTLGCRIVHLLPVGPTPTTYARFGRFGSPYACLDLTGIDPALVEFDKKTNGPAQFSELTHAIHGRGGRVMLDMVINHTGWGSSLFENHPEWFLRHGEEYASPGAWGVTWEDLAELNPAEVELWDMLAGAFLTWCRRGVDGFRCDAGYKVPVQVWQYIEARVRQQFPETLFLLEGLGGPLEATEALLTDGGMQWAYSELFQNYSGAEVARYLDFSLRQSERAGLYVHFSETHDNDRLAAKGRVWSLMRNRLCALASVCGGYGFACGVEWLAIEKINVHSSRGLAWGITENIVPELAALNRLLTQHPCFFDGARVVRLSPVDSPALALRRDSQEGRDRVLVLVNMDCNEVQRVSIPAAEYEACGNPRHDLLGQSAPLPKEAAEEVVFTLEPGAAFCLARASAPAGLSGDAYRRARAQSAWAITALGKVLLPEEIGPAPWRELARRIERGAAGFLGRIAHLDRAQSRHGLLAALDSAGDKFPQVVKWNVSSRRRVTPVPPRHWLLLHDTRPFRATLKFSGREVEDHAPSVEVHDGYVACFPPRSPARAEPAELKLERFALTHEAVDASLLFLPANPAFSSSIDKPPPDSLILLTNGRGGMARLRIDLGRIDSKYDCALGANLHPDLPVDRHVLVKRLRVWISADGFITPLCLRNLEQFEIGPPARWHFRADAGDSRTVDVFLTARMGEGANTAVFSFRRTRSASATDLPDDFDVRLTVRVDIEDRNFHTETHRNGGADYHFSSHCRPLKNNLGFAFTPAADRQLRVTVERGVFHPEPEWCQGIAHPIEQNRGQPGFGDAFSPGWFDIPLPRDIETGLVLTSERESAPPGALPQSSVNNSFEEQLLTAARAFLAKRGPGRTVIAGYPWFLDWGRDTLICARGLLAAGLADEVAQLLTTFGRFVENGTMPNTIHGENASNRDTSDAPLWYGIVCEETARRVGPGIYETAVDARGRRVDAVLADIAEGYAKGTPNGIRMDPASGLIWSPPHFTWMDTNYPAGTPRAGYPVEIQVLWIQLLRQLERLGVAARGDSWRALAGRAEESLRRYFWLEDAGYVADLLLAPEREPAAQTRRDEALRPNFLFAIAFGQFAGRQARRAMEAALEYLIVPGAVRTLAPLPTRPPLPIRAADGRLLNHPDEPYWGRYEGDEDTRRKPAYHNGTAWPWLLPTACEALARAWNCEPCVLAAARAYLGSASSLLLTGCLGQLPEILDGDAPHTPRGCDAQAWSVLETLRVWKWLSEAGA